MVDTNPAISAIYNFIVGFLAALGAVAVAAIVGLYYGGFFTFVAKHYPQSWLANLVGQLQ